MHPPIQFKAPQRGWENLSMPKVFLAGSIEGGSAAPWQAEVAQALAGYPLILLNPRRDSWLESLAQSIDEPIFREQVEWELEGLEKADFILMYFDPATRSPITLLEFGLHVQSDKLMVGCPAGFWRQANLAVTCAWHGHVLHASLDALLDAFKAKLDTAGIRPTLQAQGIDEASVLTA